MYIALTRVDWRCIIYWSIGQTQVIVDFEIVDERLVWTTYRKRLSCR